VVPSEGFRFNPLEPPMPWHQWAAIFSVTLSNCCGFYGGQSTENFAYEHLVKLYEKYDVQHGIYPSLPDFRDYLRVLKSSRKIEPRSEEYISLSRLLNRLESLCLSLGTTLECSRGFPLEELLKTHLIFDLADLKQDARAFFEEIYLTKVIRHRMFLREKGGIPRNIAFLDEGKNHFPRYREETQNSISNISFVAAYGREHGIGLCVGECAPSLLANSIKSAAYARLCFNQTSGIDIRDSAQALGLSPEQAGEIQRLQTGQAIVRLGGRINRPFVIEVTP
jgi:hypothetical protein